MDLFRSTVSSQYIKEHEKAKMLDQVQGDTIKNIIDFFQFVQGQLGDCLEKLLFPNEGISTKRAYYTLWSMMMSLSLM